MSGRNTSRRSFLKAAGAFALAGSGCAHFPAKSKRTLVNDIQSGLNPTFVDEVVRVRYLSHLQSTVKEAIRSETPLSICGRRHAMGGQQFLSNEVLVDATKLDRVLHFDRERGVIEVEAGIQWPGLLKYLLRSQHDLRSTWTFAQKQTGANRLSLGGALGSNIHSRGLHMKPFISDIESFTLIDGSGEIRKCSREENQQLFRLAIGGYGLFGVIYSIALRLVRRQKLQRVVELLDVDQLMDAFSRRINDGFLYGDFQFAIDRDSDEFLRRGVFSCYRPVPIETPLTSRKKLSTRDWLDLVHAAHVQPTRAFEEYANYYQTTSGNVYWSDLHQFSGYLDDFHQQLDRRMQAEHPASEIITEIFVPRGLLTDFMNAARTDLCEHKVMVIYGTVRLVERDDESFLAWAREPYACVIFNVHTQRTPEGIEHSAEAFRRLIDLAIARRGSYYLTYHRFASATQLQSCYPQFREFLAWKEKLDPKHVFQSDWFRHYVKSSGTIR